ncbi:MAG: radical SAM protein [Bacteroidota bacterium]
MPEKSTKPAKCAYLWQQVHIDFNGTVRPCCFVKSVDYFGNLNDNTLSEIWNGVPWQQLRQAWNDGNLAGTECDGCKMMILNTVPEVLSFPTYERTDDSPEVLNQKLSIEELKRGAITLQSKPTSLQYFPSSICNIDCEFCYQYNMKKRTLGPLGYDMVRELTPTLMQIMWIGGEPTVQKHFRSWLTEFDKMSNKNISVAIVTNGTILDNNLAKLFENGRGNANISLDAISKDLYEDIRRGASHEKTFANVRKYIDIRNGNGQFALSVSCLLQKKNLTHLPDFIQFCIDNKIPAEISPSQSFPLAERLDMFECIERELPPDWHTIMQRSVALARTLDAVASGSCEQTVVFAIDTLMRGIRRAVHSVPVRLHALPEQAGQLVSADGPAGAVTYAHVGEDGGVVVNVPADTPQKAYRFSLYNDARGSEYIGRLVPEVS